MPQPVLFQCSIFQDVTFISFKYIHTLKVSALKESKSNAIYLLNEITEAYPSLESKGAVKRETKIYEKRRIEEVTEVETYYERLKITADDRCK